jgi:hypothetical protein
VKKESFIAFCNLTHKCSFSDVDVIVSLGVMDRLLDHLEAYNPETTKLMLNALDCILEAGEYLREDDVLDGLNPYVVRLQNCRGDKALEQLQQHADTGVFMKVGEIIDKYFQVAAS